MGTICQVCHRALSDPVSIARGIGPVCAGKQGKAKEAKTMGKAANFEVVKKDETTKTLTIRDIGPWDQFLTVTNDAENVLESLMKYGIIELGWRLFYYDSDGDLDEILMNDDGAFAGFGPGSR